MVMNVTSIKGRKKKFVDLSIQFNLTKIYLATDFEM